MKLNFRIQATPRLLLFSFSTIVFIHYLLIANERYTVAQWENEYSVTYVHFDGWQYKDYIKSLDKDSRPIVIQNSTLYYFKILPAWTINIIYIAYFLWISLLIKYYLPERQLNPKKKQKIDPDFDFEEEPMSNQEKLLVASMSDEQLKRYNEGARRILEQKRKKG